MNDCDRCLNFNDCKLDKPRKSCAFVNDDMCIWRKEPSRLVGYFRNETSCDESIDLQANSELLKAFKFCPFCGKKIKVVN